MTLSDRDLIALKEAKSQIEKTEGMAEYGAKIHREMADYVAGKLILTKDSNLGWSDEFIEEAL